ncbi:MAG: RagB/SusD family nutrient uptake outer membrane protein [Dysgonamonadaceae bacterium]|jgi:hypothetical protein|nr:RagB/SusD family nutrient uptake outer membrane protein [Dysgonamonadaceae bacterium]
MKKYKNIIVWICFAVWMSSCNDDFLERSPLVNINDATYWATANDLKIYANNFYQQTSLLPNYGGLNNSPYMADARNGSDTDVYLDYSKRLNGENTLPASGGGWSSGDWTLLRNINYFMDHYHQVNAPWDEIKQYAGEALFFRSIFYFNKLCSFGDVPWSSTTVNMDSESLFESRMPRNQVTDSILHDLDLAVEYLPARTGGSWTGRVTKEVALALQARIALYEGTWEKYHALKNTPFKVDGSDGTKFIQKAADAAGALIALAEQNGSPALDNAGKENGYWSLFNQEDYSGSKEVLLWRKYSAADNQTHRWTLDSKGGMMRGLSRKMVESYLCMDGKPIAVSTLYEGDSNLKAIVANRDPRLNQTIQVDDGKHFIWYSPETIFQTPTYEGTSEGFCTTGYQLYKGHNPVYPTVFFNTTLGAIYFRYAETLLIYAEAKAELGTVTQSDIDKTVNALRDRVGMTGRLEINQIITDPNWEFAGISPLLQEIRRERKVELVCEGFRVDDIFRWAAADELIVGKKPKGAVKQQWENYPGASDAFLTAWEKLNTDEKGYIDPYQQYSSLSNGFNFNLNRDYLSPIPTTELVLNPNLKQNPGW